MTETITADVPYPFAKLALPVNIPFGTIIGGSFVYDFEFRSLRFF